MSKTTHLMFNHISAQELETLVKMVAERLGQHTQPQFLDEQTAAKFVGLTYRSLQTMRYAGTGPAFCKLGNSVHAPVRYARADLIEWVKTRRRFRSTGEAANDQE